MFRRQKAGAEAIGSHLLPRFNCLNYDLCLPKRQGSRTREAILRNSLLCVQGEARTEKSAKPWIKSHLHDLPRV